MAQYSNSGQPFDPDGWGDDAFYPPRAEARPGTFFARLLDPALFGQYATEPPRPPAGQWLAWLTQPTLLAQQGQAAQFQTLPAMAPRNPVLSPQGSVPLPRPASTGAPRTTWRGGVLPFSGDKDGNVHFDTDAGLVGATKRAVMMPGRVWSGEVDPNSDEAFEAVMELAGMAGFGPAERAMQGVKALKTLESHNPRIYDPPTLQARGFEQDYPHGARADEAGNLTQDIEGRPLVAERIVGRRVVGGADQALSPTEYVAVAERSIGSTPETVASREIGGDAGQYSRAVDRRSGNVVSRQILIDRSLPASQSNRVLAHEMAHAIDELAGQITTKGLNDELRGVYNTLNNPSPSSRAKPMGPENFGYKGMDAQGELIAEAIRAYMTNPNYFKTVAPETAAAIRAAVNNNPRLNRIIQFNMGGVPFPGAPMSDEEFQNAYWAGNAT